MNDMVSIIMPSYNTADFISESIESVMIQTYADWELIIVDDCSTDKTDEAVKPYLNDSRITYIKNTKNRGAAVTRNRALREAKGKWIAFLDSDDLWMPEKLEKQILFMESNGYSFSYTNYEEIDIDGNKTGVKVTGPKKITKTGMFNYCWPGCLTVMYDASKVGLIQIEDIKRNNDYAMWLKICRNADCYLLDECLGKYRRGRAGSISTHSIKTMVGWHYKLYREAEKMGMTESLLNTGRNLAFGLYKKKRYVIKVTNLQQQERRKLSIELNAGNVISDFSHFSVSMCVYGGDRAEWFAQAVDSVLNQTVKPDEIVLVVDGPVPDELNRIIRNYESNSFFHVIRHTENRGHGEARRTGLSQCKNELVAIMDADDICATERFEKQLIAFKKHPNADVVGGQITEFTGGEGNVVGKRVVPQTDGEIKEYMKRRCPMNLVTVMFKKSSVEKVGGFIDWYCEEDYYLWIRMALAGMKFANINDVLVNVRVGKDMYNRRGGIKYFQSEARLQKYMLDNKVINYITYLGNISKRVILQVLMPNRLRGWVFRTFARS